MADKQPVIGPKDGGIMEKKLVKRGQAEEKLKELFRHINAPIVVWNQEQKVTIFNAAFVRMSGRTETEMVGQPLETLFPEEGRSDSMQKIESAAQGEDLVEIPILHRNGGVCMGLWKSSVIYAGDGATPVATVASGQDITERKKLEARLRQARKTETIGILIGVIANDFNNALQSISGYIQLLLMRKAEGDPDCGYLNQIDRLIQGAAKLIGQLLVFGRRVESGLMPVDLNREIRRIEITLAKFITEMISIEMRLSDDLKLINVDPEQIEHVIMNLLSNARGAMPDGGRLTIETKNTVLDEKFCRLHSDAAPGEYVLLTISDTGCGMDAEALEHVFEPFYTTEKTGQRTGLGLAMVYGIVKNHNGCITCSSEPGQGTTFDLYIPVLEGIEKVEKAEEHKGVNKVDGGNETILLVDDEVPILDTACDILSQYGYTAITAENGEEAVEIYEREGDQIDLVILDIAMPGMGGHRCLEELLRINPGIKVVITTGYSAIGGVAEMLEAGAVGFIGKPYRLVDMLKKVRDVLDKK